MSGRRTNPELTAAPYKYPQPRRLSKRFAYLLTPLCLAAEATNQPTSLICTDAEARLIKLSRPLQP